jgi:hypothetical protein
LHFLGRSVVCSFWARVGSEARLWRPDWRRACRSAHLAAVGLNVEFRLGGTQEVQELGASFDRMRASMVAAFGTAGGAKGLADDDL